MSDGLLNIAKRAADAAGRVLFTGYNYRGRLKIEQKGKDDFVTNIDKDAEAAAIAVIKEYRPNDFIVAEETFTKAEFNSKDYIDKDKCTWIIDPLDGTRNFIQGLPIFAVSIAVQQYGETVAAVVYNPITEEMYTASKGRGALMNQMRLRMKPRENGSGYQGAVIATGFPFKVPTRMDRQLKMIPALIQSGLADIRRCGAASLDLCYVAAGYFDGYYEEGINCWDIAAGELIVREAGGFVMDYQGSNHYLSNHEIVAGSIEVCRELVKTINKVNKTL